MTYPQKMNFSAINQDPKQQIAQTYAQLTQLQKELHAAIDAFATQKSLLSRAAAYWSQYPLWLQIGIGLSLGGSLLLLGAIAYTALFLTLSIVAITLYGVGGFLLTDHHQQFQHDTYKFKEIIQNLTDLLGSCVHLFNTIHQQLNEEIINLQEKNGYLQQNILQLNEQTLTLAQQIDELSKAKTHLQQLLKTHEQTISDLKETNEEQSQLFNNTHKQLHEVTLQYQHTQTELSEKILQLKQINTTMSLELEQARQTAATLKGAVVNLSSTVLVKAEHKELFQQKLQQLLEDKEKGFTLITDKMFLAEAELATTQEKLQISLQQEEELRREYAQLMSRFETLIQLWEKQTPESSSSQQYSVMELKNLSLFNQASRSTKLPITDSMQEIASSYPQQFL